MKPSGRREAIRSAVVTGREAGSGGDKFLCAYLVLEKGAELAVPKLREYLSRQLTDYMIPSHFVIMDAFPLTHIGKVDRGALPDPGGIALTGHSTYVPPRNAVEEKLVLIWADILKIDANKIGVHDNFFELGGNSINILETANQIRCKIDVDISISVLFLHPAIEEIAAVIHEQEHLDRLECIVRLNNGRNETNIFIIHPFHGLVYPYRELAGLLENDYNVYGIQARGLVKDSKLPGTSAEMVADYIYQIKEIQDQGPYIIVGFCFGSVVAYEIVKQLEDMNSTVEKLIFLDEHAFIPDQTFRYFERLERKMERKKIHTVFKPFKNLLRRLKKRKDKDNRPGGPGVFSKDPEKRKERVDANNRKLDEGFVLSGIINTPLLVIKAEASDNPRFGMEYMVRMSRGEVTIVEVAGEHNTILARPYVKRAAEIINNM
jgi:thioesterase domain-containing protein